MNEFLLYFAGMAIGYMIGHRVGYMQAFATIRAAVVDAMADWKKLLEDGK